MNGEFLLLLRVLVVLLDVQGYRMIEFALRNMLVVGGTELQVMWYLIGTTLKNNESGLCVRAVVWYLV